MKRFLETTLLVAAATVAIGALTGCGKVERTAKAADTTTAQAAVVGSSDVAVVERTDLVSGVTVSGTLAPTADVLIGAPIGDVVEEMLVREGQRVVKGQVLARFRTTAVEPAAAGAESRYRAARADHTRMQNLLREGAVAERDVEVAEAALREAESARAYARKQLEEATVRAPVTGAVAERMVQAGARPGLGDPILRVVDTRELEFEATVTTDDITQVRVGVPVVLDVTGFPRSGVEGRVARVNATADPATRQVKVYVTVPNHDGRLVGGLFASGRIVVKRARQVLAVPSSGVRGAGAGAVVWVLVNGQAIPRRVTLGMKDESRDLVEVVSGLEAGLQAIVGPVSALKPGQPVQVAKREG